MTTNDTKLKNNFSKLKNHYEPLFDTKKENSTFFAPGRVNLIGEYTDFNGGLVLPCAIQYGTYLIVQSRNDQSFHFHSMNCPETVDISIDILKKLTIKEEKYAWCNYPLGILKQFENKLSTGFNFFFYGNIPLGSGLSSSASIERVTAFALNTILNEQYSLTNLAQLCQHAENQFIGLHCGIMDMYSIAHGQADHAMMINCENNTHTYTPIEMGALSWLIINSNKTRKLSESKYNKRNQECQQALSILNLTRKLDNLCQLPIGELKQARDEITDNVIYKRLHHVVTEHQRVNDCHIALKNNQWGKVAELLNASHQSLSKDFQVSGEILDKLVAISLDTEGVMAARMTGAGFGGCTINLISKKHESSIIKTIKKNYKSATGLDADFYISQASQGTHEFTQDINI